MSQRERHLVLARLALYGIDGTGLTYEDLVYWSAFFSLVVVR